VHGAKLYNNTESIAITGYFTNFATGKTHMKYISEYRDKSLVRLLIQEIRKHSRKEIVLMEVCGGHTMAIHKFGIPALLPCNIRLVSGPGCPVCVTSKQFIDHIAEIARQPNVIITTYGDLIRVQGSVTSLDHMKAKGFDIRIVYSTIDALHIARQNPDKKVVFPGIGFETTAPATAAALINARAETISNFFVLSAHKIMPPAMEALITEGVKINGYICPGHVSTITGTEIYKFIPERYGLACVISGFEPVDILQAVLMLVKQIENDAPSVEIQYKRAVKPQGNIKARAMMAEVFEYTDDWWRGFGNIAGSGLKIRKNFENHNAAGVFDVQLPELKEDKGCICGEILKGLKKPCDCRLYSKICTPANPVGACMVSNEGACAAHYRYSV
jgi:hydrogenase expression/formation protein HypD